MSKIPNKISISGYIIPVKMYKFIDKNSVGFFVASQMEIHIDEDRPKSRCYSIFLHEVMEAVNYIYDLDLDHHKILLLEAALFNLGVKIKGV